MISVKVTSSINRSQERSDLARKARDAVNQTLDRIAVRARQLAPSASGDLRRSIQAEPARMKSPTVATGRVIALAPYAIYQHEGTGIYGPRGRRIYPHRSKALRFVWKKAGGVVFFRSVRGVKGTKFLTRATNEVLNQRSRTWKVEYFVPIAK